ncbi:MAG: GGDEF domain-containing response regulator [Vulcanimicrobiaceae bacterium]|jgi:diguanylate cyclase (GGDEF)-like protein
MTAIASERPLPGERAIKVLIVDDNPIDGDLSLRELRRAGLVVEGMIAADEVELRAALRTFVPDVVLCDFSFPNFDGMTAQRIVQETYVDTPLIFVSGTISEEGAAMALQSGGVDYVMKSSLIRLPSAVQRAVREARATAAAAERARAHADRLEVLWRVANNPALRGHELIVALVRQAATAISPPQHFRGLLYSVDANDLVVMVDVDGPGGDPPRAALRQLTRRRTLETPSVPGARSHGWDDIETGAALPSELAGQGWRAVICTQFEAGGTRYGLTFASGEPGREAFSAQDFAYLDVLAASVAHQVQVNELEDSLRDEEEHSRAHAHRLEALWQIVNDSALSDADKWLAMLAQASASVWPGHGCRGMLWRIHDTEMTLEAVAESPGHQLTGVPLEVGNVIPTATSVAGMVFAEGKGIRSWDDVQFSAYATDVTRMRGVHACVVTTFTAGSATWALQFVSGLAAGKPLGQQEHAYIEVLASFFANHVQQRWQFERIEYEQSHDVLTGLLNRSHFRSQARSRARASSRSAIIVIDINAFREINESYGHTIGDALIVEIANELQLCAFRDEIIGRIGGDVFAIYIENPRSDEFVLVRAQSFAEVFSRPFSMGDRAGGDFIARNASIGVAVTQDNGQSIEAILLQADAALAVAKERGQGSIVLYEAGMESDAQRRTDLRNELGEAVEHDQFTLYYQPHVDLRNGKVSGCEALIRWNHPERGLVSPDDFIPFAEQAGIITRIDSWVMRNAFVAAGELCESRPGFRLYFNLSGRQAGDPRLVRSFIDAARSGVRLENMGVEITESDAMRDVEATRHVFRSLRRLNVRVAIDDFGTGYSSLSSLKRLPVDVVKIDQSFISGVTSNRHDAAIADTIISLAEHFGLESLGEGAEEPEDVEWLRQHRCGYVQGYAICRPMPMAAFKLWLAEHDRNLLPAPEARRAPLPLHDVKHHDSAEPKKRAPRAVVKAR